MSATMTATMNDQEVMLGLPVPPFTAHAISVSLPTWKDNVGYEEGEKRVADAMVNGYPRFFIHLTIQKLASICKQKFAMNGERCLLCPTRKVAEMCRAFMLDRAQKENKSITVRLVQFLITPEDDPDEAKGLELHIVLFPDESFPLAKQFWQHSGVCISSRRAERCLSILPQDPPVARSPPPAFSRPTKMPNRHYSNKRFGKSPPHSPTPTNVFEKASSTNGTEVLTADQAVYVEERYGRNLPVEEAAAAKRALRRRIAGVLVGDSASDWPKAGAQDVELGPSTRGVEGVTEDDVFLYPTGMGAIFSAHQLALGARPPAKSVCFGFPYTDTLKILEKWGPGCHFLGHGLDEDIDALEGILEEEAVKTSGPPVLALFTETPSNPLLRCADLPRLRVLANKYDFLIVVDETIGNFVNVEVLPYADVVVSSLSKVFSGDSNVMGGSLVLNPKGRHYATLKAHLEKTYEDLYFDEDAIFMERNSRDFMRRIEVIDANALAICTFLRDRSLAAPSPPPNTVVKEVYYPKWITRHNYEKCRTRKGAEDEGFGGLFSLTFSSLKAAQAFFDTLQCHKGPSLGTNFTLACPYTILAHYLELEWAAGWGVESSLVRVSVGMEDREELLAKFAVALEAAEAVGSSADA